MAAEQVTDELKTNTNESMEMNEKKIRPYVHEIQLNIGNEKWARILAHSVSVDKEVNPNNFQRQIVQQNDKIIVYFEASKWKWLRVGIQSFCNNIQLCLQTIQMFENYY
eukprot:297748_1